MPEYVWLVQYNPLVYIIETTRYMLFDEVEFRSRIDVHNVVPSVLLLVGILIFQKPRRVL
jgi:lipopolysaccharide transport system permease protein